MTFTTHNTKKIDTNGCSLQGRLTATYDELVHLFGTPTSGDAYKVDAHWAIEFVTKDGPLLATVYNWKDGKGYCGVEGKATEQITDWHVGGFGAASYDNVQIALDLSREAEMSELEEKMGSFASAMDIMQTTESVRGEMFADTVRVALYARKHSELMSMLIQTCIDAGSISEATADMLMRIDADMSSKIIAMFARRAGIDQSNITDAKLIMSTADRVMACEESGALEMIAKMGRE